jgi:hypothetical protein
MNFKSKLTDDVHPTSDLARVARRSSLEVRAHFFFLRQPSKKPLSGVEAGGGFTPVTWRKEMSKTISIAILMMMMALTPAYTAAPKECTDAHMKQMDAMIAKMTDTAKQKAATTALNMSKAEMNKGNMKGCMKYMNQAHSAMGLQ